MPKFIKTIFTINTEKLNRLQSFGFITSNGVTYDENLAGPDGMQFVLIQEYTTTDAMLNDAVDLLRRDRDVVGEVLIATVKD